LDSVRTDHGDSEYLIGFLLRPIDPAQMASGIAENRRGKWPKKTRVAPLAFDKLTLTSFPGIIFQWIFIKFTHNVRQHLYFHILNGNELYLTFLSLKTQILTLGGWNKY
jgi:hypothetical protein